MHLINAKGYQIDIYGRCGVLLLPYKEELLLCDLVRRRETSVR